MIRQEVMRRGRIAFRYQPSAAERHTEIAIAVIYQRTYIVILLTVGILVQNLRAIGKIVVVVRVIAFAVLL